MKDNGSTMTMLSQKTTVYNTSWYGSGSSSRNEIGPTTILSALESATSGWSNVNNQTYALRTTSFNSLGQYTGCSAYNSCTSNKYTLPSRTAKARLITVQEATDSKIGKCTETDKSCEIWMYNYLSDSTEYGGTRNESSLYYMGSSAQENMGYWTSNAYSENPVTSWIVETKGKLSTILVGVTTNVNPNYGYGARVVVEVNK